MPSTRPILRILADHSGVTVLCLQSAEVRQQLAMRLKTVKVPGLSNKRVFFRGPSGAVSEACRAQRRRVRSQSPPEVSSPESGEARVNLPDVWVFCHHSRSHLVNNDGWDMAQQLGGTRQRRFGGVAQATPSSTSSHPPPSPPSTPSSTTGLP